MARRDTYEASTHTGNPTEPVNDQPRDGAGWRILDYATFVGLIVLGILLVGLISSFLFGSSVSTAL